MLQYIHHSFSVCDISFHSRCLLAVFIRPVMDFNATTTAPSGNLMNIHVTWLPSTGDVEYIVTVTDPVISAVPSCTSPGLNPPCFVARDTVSWLTTNINYINMHVYRTWLYKVTFLSSLFRKDYVTWVHTFGPNCNKICLHTCMLLPIISLNRHM